MRIEVVTEGGFAALPGLQKPLVLDCDALPADVAARCRDLVRELAAVSHVSAAPAALRDGRRYTIRVESDGQPLSLAASDTAMSEAFRALLELARTHGKRQA
jgi:hypothetical protein